MHLYAKLIFFIFASGYFIWLSRHVLRKVRIHGFYRLLAWEAILALVLFNIDFWFDNWLSARQILSWVLLAISAYLITFSVIELFKSGKPGSTRIDPGLIGIEKTTRLVKTGIYKYIRHPMYSSAVIGVWGVVLKNISAVSIILALLSVGFLAATAKVEESENIQYFGEEYRNYMKRTKMFIPYLF